MERSIKTLVVLMAAMVVCPEMKAQSDDFGVWSEVNVERKVNKRLDVGGGIEVRLRDNAGEVDRMSVGINGSYKLLNWLKFGAGISFLDDNRYKLNNKGTKFASYWSPRVRVTAGLTASYSFGDLGISLRERWQYTLRPQYTTYRYWTYTDDDDDRYYGEVADVHTYRTKAKNAWRNRLQLKYKLSKTFRPYASVETSVAHGLEKVRYAAGTEIRLSKQHWLDVKYLYQNINEDEDGEGNSHIVGIGYTYKF